MSSGAHPMWRTIWVGGLTVGVLDCLAATLNAGRKGVSFTRVWQYVASGLLGSASYRLGAKSVALGLLVHFFIAFSVTAIYVWASRWLTVLRQRAVLCGTLYGIAVYFFMANVVTPLSAAARLPFSWQGLAIGLAIHIVCIGLPIALITRKG